MKRLYLIDGHSLIFRMYYAFIRRPMINSKGEDTSILFGFTKYLMEFIRRENPTHLAVAFDPPAKTFRHEMYEDYKANRQATPELVKSALDPLCEIVKALNIPVVMIPGYEADDVIGAMAKKAERDGYKVYMVTPDKDYGQLVSENILQCKPGKSGADDEVLGPEQIKEIYNIERPEQVIDILTLWGDSSDNVPGVRGIGEVSAKKLIGKYGSIDNIYTHIEELPEKQRVAFEEAKEHLPMSRELITIKSDIDIDISEDDLKLNLIDCPKIIPLFEKYEFNSLLRLLPEGCIDQTKVAELKEKSYVKYIDTDIDNIIRTIKEKKEFSVIIKYRDNSFITSVIEEVIIGVDNFVCRQTEINSKLKILFEDKSILKTGTNLKFYISLLKEQGIRMRGYLADTELMHYLISPESSHKSDILVKTYLNLDMEESGDEEGVNQDKAPNDLFSTIEEPSDESKDREERKRKREVVALSMLYHKLKEVCTNEGLIDLYNKIEMPLIYVLADMEYEGVKIDTQLLKDYSLKLQKELDEIERSIRDEVNEPDLNISSPKQLGVLLYEKLTLNKNVRKNNKQNYPTDEETLNELRDKHPIIDQILEYRAVKKLLSTYIDPFPTLIEPKSGKIHTTFNQALTATGRLSSVRPNLQNIPIKTERGREIRKAFIPSRENGCIISADYSQIELRLMAAMSNDPSMIEAFKKGQDIHTATAAKVFKVTLDEVTREQRNKAKVANFGIIYGISTFGLSQRLNIPRKEASDIIEGYFESFPKVKEYMNNTIEQGRQKGYVETLFGRKRFLPDINSKNNTTRGIAERNAINAPIQGSAADLIKIAMINIYKRLIEEGFNSKMVLQVHDELVFDVNPDEVERLLPVIRHEMESVLKLDVDLIVECGYGKNWLEAH